MYLLGYDIGSSTIKAALVNADTQEVLGVVQHPDQGMDMISRQGGWAEQQPEAWWQHFCTVTRKLLFKFAIDPKDIKAIGLAYQMHGLVLIDKNQQVLRPSIIWCDSRAVSIGEQAFSEIGEAFCLENFLNAPGNFTASKLKWIKDNEPEIYGRIHKILLPGDFIAMKLTGIAATSITGLSEGIFWNFKEKRIAQEVLNYYEFDPALIPKCLPTFSVQGLLSKEAAAHTGLVPGTPITYRAGDQPNNALALNVLNPGEIAATSETSGVVYGIVDRPLYDIKSRVNAFAHVNYEDNFDRIGILLCLNGAGIQYSWMKHQVARSGRSYQDMERMVSTIPIGANGLGILPFGNGAERMLENRNLNMHLFNLQFNRHTRAHLYRAALEGVAFSFVYGVNILKELGLTVDIIRVGNDNMFQSKAFSMTIATLLGCHIEMVATTGAIGAARAAGVAGGVYGSLDEALKGILPSVIYEPRLNPAQCNQAYNFWLSHLNQMLSHEKGRRRGKNDYLEIEKESLEKMLYQKNKKLATSTMQLIEKNNLLLEIKQSINKLAKDPKAIAIQSELQKILKRLEEDINMEQDRAEFEEYFDFIHSDFLKRLKEQYPQLSLPELKLCAYLKMNLSTKEIASRLNLSVRGVETRRYRLRKKLQFSKEHSFTSFFAEI